MNAAHPSSTPTSHTSEHAHAFFLLQFLEVAHPVANEQTAGAETETETGDGTEPAKQDSEEDEDETGTDEDED